MDTSAYVRGVNHIYCTDYLFIIQLFFTVATICTDIFVEFDLKKIQKCQSEITSPAAKRLICVNRF
jgi:hypothetical protein